MRQFGFLDWEVYNDAQNLFTEILKIWQILPQNLRHSLGNQCIRSSLSVTLNIAEGGGRHSGKELKRFLDIALGSAYETLACIDTMRRNALITEAEFVRLRDRISSICKQIGAFKKTVN